MADTINPDPGFAFKEGSEQIGPIWLTDTVLIIERDATTALAGRVKKMPLQADSTAATVADQVIEFNALLAKLKTAGLMEDT